QRRRLRIHPLFQRTQPVCLVHLSTLGNPNASTAMAIHLGLWGYDFQSASQTFLPRTSFSKAEPDTYIDDLSGSWSSRIFCAAGLARNSSQRSPAYIFCALSTIISGSCSLIGLG